MRKLIAIVIVALLGACSGQATRLANGPRFDFGPAAGAVGTAGAAGVAMGIAAVEVNAPTWLGDGAMQYRLLYAEPAQRREYAENRWVARPGELLEQSLARRLAAPAVGRCRLRVELDEFIQVFDSAASSRLLVSGRAILYVGVEASAGRSFALDRPAPSADAKGGVAAASAAVAALGDELAQWVSQSGKCRSE
jgi:cholesterol transport system auxiliary component